MKSIKLIALIISILAVLSSCTSKSGSSNSMIQVLGADSLRTESEAMAIKKVRAHRWYLSDHFNYVAMHIEIINVDTMYKVGDTVIISNENDANYYIIQP